MDFTEREKSFVDRFNKGIYEPDLLFDQKEIVERIKNHPMAIWKTRVKQ